MTQLVRYEAMRVAIAAAASVDEAKDIADKATALAAYARQANDPELERQVAEIRVRAKRRIGQLTAALPDAPVGRRKSDPTVDPIPSKYKLAMDSAKLSRAEVIRCEQLADIDDAVFERYLAEKQAEGVPVSIRDVMKAVKQAAKKADVVEHIEAFDGCTVAELDSLIAAGQRFGCIYADPPWLYDNQATRASTGNHYNGMTVEDLCGLPIGQLAEKDAHLHLWVTNAFLFDAPRIFAAWGFEFRSTFVWVKPQMGIGNYWRNSHEILLTAIRGDARRFNARNLVSWGEFDRAQHSAKPEQIRDMIQRASDGPYLELFGRRKTDGWTVWGNQIERNLFHAEAA